MEAIYKLNIDELSADLLKSLKIAFKGKKVEITIREVSIDETDYLLATSANRKHLETSMEDLEAGKGIVFNTEDFLKAYKAKVSTQIKKQGKNSERIHVDENDI